jgi:hypothetical protein
MEKHGATPLHFVAAFGGKNFPKVMLQRDAPHCIAL